MLEATIEQSNGSLAASVGDQHIDLGQETLSQRPELRAFAGKKVILGIRPEDLEDATLVSDRAEGHTLTGVLELREALGSEIMAHFTIRGNAAETDETRELARDQGGGDGDRHIGVDEGLTVVVGRFGARSRVQKGDTIRAVVDTRALHFFDPETGLGIYGNGASPA
jgi:multiple sugar transport system ATP-binding protein